jgi:hypothetical protein
VANSATGTSTITSLPYQLPASPPESLNDSRANAAKPGLQRSTETIFYGGFYFAGCDLGDISSHDGIPIFSDRARRWIELLAGTEAFSNGKDPGEEVKSAPIYDRITATKSWDALPPRSQIETCFAIYQGSLVRLVFPVLDPILFHRTIDLAYEPDPYCRGTDIVNAKVCILAFVALVSVLEPEKIQSLSGHAASCALMAEQLLLSALSEPTINGLQASIMLVRLPFSFISEGLFERILGHISRLFWSTTICSGFKLHGLSLYSEFSYASNIARGVRYSKW